LNIIDLAIYIVKRLVYPILICILWASELLCIKWNEP